MLDKLAYAIAKERLRLPCSLILFVTDRCNVRCLHCFNWENVARPGASELTLDEIDGLSTSLRALSELSLSGGEPFLREDLAEILQIFIRNNNLRSFSIPTNGLLTDVIFRETKRILEASKGVSITINLSLDGMEEEHDYLRQREGAFQQLMNTYEKIKSLKRGHDLKLKLLTTLYSRNICQLDELMEFVSARMSEVDFHNFEILRAGPRAGDILPPAIQQLEEAKEKIFRYWKGFNFYGKSFSSKPAYWLKRYLFELYIRILKEKRQVIPCFAGTFTLVVDASGNAYFCELLPAIGNIRENTLKALLSSPQAQAQRQKIKAGGCYCVHSCFQGKNLYLNYKLYLPFLAYVVKKKIWPASASG